jgi:hypothetical protein
MGLTVPLGRAPDTLEWTQQRPVRYYLRARMGRAAALGVLPTASNKPNNTFMTRSRYARMDPAAPL